MSNTCFKCGKAKVTTELCDECLIGGKKVNQQIENNFMYHSPKPGQPETYNYLREKAKELAYHIDELCPDSREKSLALTNLEQAMFWANASVARN